MPVLKNKTQGNFTMVSNGILRDKELPLKERGLLVTLLGLPDNWDFSINGLDAILPDGRDKIKTGLRKLEKMGYLTRYQARSENGVFGDLIVEVNEIPAVVPQVENPSAVNPSTDKPHTEKHQQYNTNKYKTKEYKKQKYVKGDSQNGNSKSNGAGVNGSKRESSWTKSEIDLYGF